MKEDQDNVPNTENPDQLPFVDPVGDKHPSAEIFLVRQAIEKTLNNRQREVWALHAYDRLTENEMAKKLRISQQAVSKRLAVIERKIMKWCERHQNTYKLIKMTEKLYGDHHE